jgi:hypothetical protein
VDLPKQPDVVLLKETRTTCARLESMYMKPFIQNKGGILAASLTTEGFSLSLLGSHRQGGLADYK